MYIYDEIEPEITGHLTGKKVIRYYYRAVLKCN